MPKNTRRHLEISTDNLALKIVPLHFDLITWLIDYYYRLSLETKKRFLPHAFDFNTLEKIVLPSSAIRGFVGILNDELVSYHAIKSYSENFERNRMAQWNISLPDSTIYYAPSVMDEFQGKGIGKRMWEHVLFQAKDNGIKCIVLWGGVQSTNLNAIHYYEKIGFQFCGRFFHEGENYEYIYNL